MEFDFLLAHGKSCKMEKSLNIPGKCKFQKYWLEFYKDLTSGTFSEQTDYKQ